MKKILIVGSILFRIRVKSILGRADFHIFQATNNDEALELHRTHNMNLIISRIDIEGMSTEEFCDKVRQEPDLKTVAIVLICNNNPNEINRCKSIKTNGFITQPFDNKVFDANINAYLDVPKRQSYRVFTSLKFDDKSSTMPHHCKMLNISSTGILVEAREEFNIGEKLSFSFFLPSSARISAKGEIVRVVPSMSGIYQYGIKFSPLPTDMQTELDQFIMNNN